MLSLFRPRCPLNAAEKTWIEYRLSWLLEHLGAERLRRMETILPTGEFFPLPYRGEPEEIQAVFDRTCQVMEVEPSRYHLHLFDENTDQSDLPERPKDLTWEMGTPLPLHEGVLFEPAETNATQIGALHMHRGLAADLELVIAIFSREISQSRLLGRSDLDLDRAAYQHSVELMPLLFGLGIFGANAVVREKSHNVMGWHFWSMIPQGALPARYFGYALALLCWLRREPLPPWRSLLRKDAEGTMRASLRYLQKTGNAILDPDSPANPYHNQSHSEWLDDLKHGTPGRRVAALWAIEDHAGEINPGRPVEIITDNLRHDDPIVRAAAARTLDALGQTAAEAVPDLLIALEDRNGTVRMMAALALGRMTDKADAILPRLMPLLEDRNIHTANAAAWSIGQFGHQAEEAGPALVGLLRRGILHCREDTLDDILSALCAVTDHPEDVVTETLLERDSETCGRALDLLKEHQLDSVTQES